MSAADDGAPPDDSSTIASSLCRNSSEARLRSSSIVRMICGGALPMAMSSGGATVVGDVWRGGRRRLQHLALGVDL